MVEALEKALPQGNGVGEGTQQEQVDKSVWAVCFKQRKEISMKNPALFNYETD